MAVIDMATQYRCRPSEILTVTDGYAAYCLDEACLYIRRCLEEGKHPFFRSVGRHASGSAATVELLRQLGAEVHKV